MQAKTKRNVVQQDLLASSDESIALSSERHGGAGTLKMRPNRRDGGSLLHTWCEQSFNARNRNHLSHLPFGPESPLRPAFGGFASALLFFVLFVVIVEQK